MHRLEDVFARVRDGALALDPEAFDRLFAGATALRDAIEQAGREGTEGRDLGPERAELERMSASAPAPAPTRGPAPLPRPSRRRAGGGALAPRRPRPSSGARTRATPRGPASCAWSSRSSTTCSTSSAS